MYEVVCLVSVWFSAWAFGVVPKHVVNRGERTFASSDHSVVSASKLPKDDPCSSNVHSCAIVYKLCIEKFGHFLCLELSLSLLFRRIYVFVC